VSKGETYLVQKCQQGDVEAFEVILKMYEKRIYNFAYRMLGDKEDAMDITQEVFIKAYKSVNAFKGNSSFSTWLFKIAKNVCIDYLRKNGKVRIFSLDKTIKMDGGEIKKETPDTSNLPEEIVKRKEIQHVVHQAIARLPEKYKEAIILRDLQDFSYKEIADILNCNIGTVKSRISRGRKELKNILLYEMKHFPLTFV